MSTGNTKTQGNQGNNFPFQFKNLQLLGDILTAVAPAGGLATEATLLLVLAALQNGQEFEQNLVMDLGGVGCPNNCPTYLQVRVWNTVTHTFDPPVYYDATGAVVVPVGPLEIVNPQYVLEDMLVQLTSINTNVLTTTAFQARINTLGQKTMANSTPVVLPSDQSAIPVTGTFFPAGVVRTPTLLRATGAGTVAAGSQSVSVYNAGNANGTWLGVSIKPGEQLSYSAKQSDTLGAFAYDGTGTELVITYLV